MRQLRLFPLDLGDLVGLGAARRDDFHRGALLLADQRACERRGDRDAAFLRIGFGLADDLPDLLLLGVLVDGGDGRAELDGVAGQLRHVDDVGARELVLELARADIIDISKLSGDTIKFGATVTLIDEDTEQKTVWQIVGEVEADAKKGKISITSPLARALIGKKKGASVEVVTPGGAKAYEITKVEWR